MLSRDHLVLDTLDLHHLDYQHVHVLPLDLHHAVLDTLDHLHVDHLVLDTTSRTPGHLRTCRTRGEEKTTA